MSEQIAKFLVDLVLAVLMFVICQIIVKSSKSIWKKFRTRKDPVIA